MDVGVDTHADLSGFENPLDYYHQKTQKLLDFGVQQVIWFFSDSQKVTVAQPQKAWITTGWEENILLLEEYTFSLNELLDKEGIHLS